MSSEYNVGGITYNPELPCPPEILKQQVFIEVGYINFDGSRVSGAIEVNKLVAADVKAFFEQALLLNFPIEKVASASESPYKWNDDKIMDANVTSGFNYRLIADTDTPSQHGKGLAFDVNPRQNPYIRYKDGQEIIAPAGAIWQPAMPGTLSAEHPLVRLMIGLGWEWGGNWTAGSGRIDYQHFQKNISI